jgi:2-C-methyl-D-erythritol 4-phosphate cytidylyltransferase
MKKYAVIVGGGRGSRMGHAEPKQFLLLQQKPVFWHTVKKFMDAFDDIEIIVVLPADWIEKGKHLLNDLNSNGEIKFCTGGETRFHSVRAGLQFIKEDSIVFIHDAVRCLVSNSLIHHCFQHAMENGSAIPVTDAKDSIRLVETNGSRSIDRHLIKLVQTPQTFKSNIILSAYQQPYQEGFTDEAMVVESLGETVSLVDGDPKNIKITLPTDLLVASQLLSDQ